jgi:hypothetical protein
MAETEYYGDMDDYAPTAGERLRAATHWLGAVTSLALIAGIAVWGYKLSVRDVTGIPVVRALEGPMRVAPEDPGGRMAAHQGLAVNAVAAEGEAAPPPDRLVLAPRPIDLSDEDLPMAVLQPEPPEPIRLTEGTATAALAIDPDAPTEAEPQLDAAVDSDSVSAMTDALAREVVAEMSGPSTAVYRSPRPEPRPMRATGTPARPLGNLILASAPLPFDTVPSPASQAEIDGNSLPAGTRLVQLGAFDDIATARAEWDRLHGRFAAYLEGRTRVIQEAESGGRSFYRLRAGGFDGDADARRFCAALLAEQTACIPVLVR